MTLLTTPAILLRSMAYGESSRILRFFTSEIGSVSVMARGVRQNGARGGTGLETFAGGSLSAYVRRTRDLQTFKDFVPATQRRGLGENVLKLGGAGLVGELALRHSGEEANAMLFEALETALDRLESVEEPRVVERVLSEAWRVVSVLGYGPEIDDCVVCGATLGEEEVGRFDLSAGGIRCARCGDGNDPRVGPVARMQLRSLLQGDDIPERLIRPRVHLHLLSAFIVHHVSGGRPLESAAFLAQVFPADDA